MVRKKLKNIVSVNEELYNFLKIKMFVFSSIIYPLIGDEAFVKIQYFLRLGRRLNLNNPKLYNEKLQWLKLNYRDPLLKKCVDKWEVRNYVASKGLSSILLPAFGPYESVKNIKIDELPDKFIVKLTNGSGFNEICFDKKNFSFEKLENKFKSWQKLNFYHLRREWAYDGVPNRIICEALLCDGTKTLPSDIRFFCFHGKVKFIAIDLESIKNGKKTSNYYRHIFDHEWREIDATIQYPRKHNFSPNKPINFTKMIEIAENLSEDFPSVRVDLYNLGGKIYFGELTFYHASGYQKIRPRSFEDEMGECLSLSLVKNEIQFGK